MGTKLQPHEYPNTHFQKGNRFVGAGPIIIGVLLLLAMAFMVWLMIWGSKVTVQRMDDLATYQAVHPSYENETVATPVP